MPAKIHEFKCQWCNNKRTWKYGKYFRFDHIKIHHPELIGTPELEWYIARTINKDLDLDHIVQRYKDRLENSLGLKRKGIFIDKLLRTIGVYRHYGVDNRLLEFDTDNMTKPEEVTAALTAALVGRFLKCSPEVRHQGYLNRDMQRLRNQGFEELIPTVTKLKTIKYIKKTLEKELEALKETESDTETT